MIACGSKPPQPGTPESILTNIPEWYASPLNDKNYLFAANTSTSRDMQLAVDKAKQQARTDLGSQVEAKLEALTESFANENIMKEESGLLAQFIDASKSVASIAMNRIKEKNREIQVESGIYRAYVLMEMPQGAISAALMQQIQNNQDLHHKLSETQAFKELENKVEEYEQFKKEHGMIR
jgi:hypothetical protein